MKYLHLIKLLTYNYFKKHFIKIVFAIIGMSTGIAIFVATNVYKETIYNDVSKKERLIQQTDEWLIISETGRISEKIVQEIIDLKVFDKIAPKSQRVEYIYDDENKTIPARFVGIDLDLRFETIGTNLIYLVLMNAKLMQIPVFGSNYFKKSGSLKLRNRPTANEIFVTDTIAESPNDSPFIVTDIAFYQALFEDRGWIDELGVHFTGNQLSGIQKLLEQIDPKLSLISQNKYLGKNNPYRMPFGKSAAVFTGSFDNQHITYLSVLRLYID